MGYHFEKIKKSDLPAPVGTYRMHLGASKMDTPFYGHRKEFLPLVGKTMTQIRIYGFGGLYWINVDDTDIVLLNTGK